MANANACLVGPETIAQLKYALTDAVEKEAAICQLIHVNVTQDGREKTVVNMLV
jgi:hypothetical protein